nr:7360_t:CDS:2 [Entrophospora candida]CAG8572073.1 12038_t:CDS:2 [Entrophospora candida]
MESIEITANNNSATTTTMEGIVTTIPEKTFIDSTGTETLTKNHNRQENGNNQNDKGHQSNLGDASDNQGKNILAESLVDSATCGRRMFLASLIVASKYLQDNNYSNNAWSKISGLSLKEINSIERRFLQLIVYNLYVSEEVFNNWTNLGNQTADNHKRNFFMINSSTTTISSKECEVKG